MERYTAGAKQRGRSPLGPTAAWRVDDVEEGSDPEGLRMYAEHGPDPNSPISTPLSQRRSVRPREVEMVPAAQQKHLSPHDYGGRPGRSRYDFVQRPLPHAPRKSSPQNGYLEPPRSRGRERDNSVSSGDSRWSEDVRDASSSDARGGYRNKVPLGAKNQWISPSSISHRESSQTRMRTSSAATLGSARKRRPTLRKQPSRVFKRVGDKLVLVEREAAKKMQKSGKPDKKGEDEKADDADNDDDDEDDRLDEEAAFMVDAVTRIFAKQRQTASRLLWLSLIVVALGLGQRELRYLQMEDGTEIQWVVEGLRALTTILCAMTCSVLYDFHESEFEYTQLTRVYLLDTRIWGQRRISQFLLECFIAIIHEPPFISVIWGNSVSDLRMVFLNDSRVINPWGVLVVLRLYLVARYILSKLYPSGTRIVGLWYNFDFSWSFSVRNLLYTRPLMTIIPLLVALIIFSSYFMWQCERVSGDHNFTLPSAIYLIIITMTGVGYGDLFPETECGRAISISVAILSTLLVAVLVAAVHQKLALRPYEARMVEFIDRSENRKELANLAVASVSGFMSYHLGRKRKRSCLTLAYRKRRMLSGLYRFHEARRKMTAYEQRYHTEQLIRSMVERLSVNVNKLSSHVRLIAGKMNIDLPVDSSDDDDATPMPDDDNSEISRPSHLHIPHSEPSSPFRVNQGRPLSHNRDVTYGSRPRPNTGSRMAVMVRREDIAARQGRVPRNRPLLHSKSLGHIIANTEEKSKVGSAYDPVSPMSLRPADRQAADVIAETTRQQSPKVQQRASGPRERMDNVTEGASARLSLPPSVASSTQVSAGGDHPSDRIRRPAPLNGGSRRRQFSANHLRPDDRSEEAASSSDRTSVDEAGEGYYGSSSKHLLLDENRGARRSTRGDAPSQRIQRKPSDHSSGSDTVHIREEHFSGRENDNFYQERPSDRAVNEPPRRRRDGSESHRQDYRRTESRDERPAESRAVNSNRLYANYRNDEVPDDARGELLKDLSAEPYYDD